MSHLCFLAFKLDNPKASHPSTRMIQKALITATVQGSCITVASVALNRTQDAWGKQEGEICFLNRQSVYALKEKLRLSLNLSSSSNCKWSYS